MARLQIPQNTFRSRHAILDRKRRKVATDLELHLYNETDLDGVDGLPNIENRALFNLGSGCSWRRPKINSRFK